MQQRAMIAAALIRRPRLIIADEPTTALDATVQHQILELLAELRTRIRVSLILISHDLAVVRNVCDRVYVMYAGQIVERGPAAEIFRHPQHPYTQALVDSILDPGRRRGTSRCCLARRPTWSRRRRVPISSALPSRDGDLPDDAAGGRRAWNAIRRRSAGCHASEKAPA